MRWGLALVAAALCGSTSATSLANCHAEAAHEVQQPALQVMLGQLTCGLSLSSRCKA